MYTFFEKCTKGGISYICNRYSKADNKYLNSYDPKQESNHIIYLDANDFYGYAMSRFLEFIFSLTLINMLVIVQKDVFSKLILNILKSYENYTMIIL